MRAEEIARDFHQYQQNLTNGNSNHGNNHQLFDEFDDLAQGKHTGDSSSDADYADTSGGESNNEGGQGDSNFANLNGGPAGEQEPTTTSSRSKVPGNTSKAPSGSTGRSKSPPAEQDQGGSAHDFDGNDEDHVEFLDEEERW